MKKAAAQAKQAAAKPKPQAKKKVKLQIQASQAMPMQVAMQVPCSPCRRSPCRSAFLSKEITTWTLTNTD